MNKRLLYTRLLLFMFIILSSSCNTEEPGINHPILIEIETSFGRQDSLLADAAGISYDMMEAAIPFRTALRNDQLYRSAVYVYDSKSVTTFLDKPQQLAARIAMLGIKDVYMSASRNAMSGSDEIRANWLRLFNKAAHEYGLKVWALRMASYAQFADDNLIIEECARVLAFNSAVAPGERFDGVSADWEPHVLKEGGANTPPGMTYFWDSSKNYGIGGSNDMLLKRTLEMLKLARNNLNGLPLNEAIHYMYQNNFNSGNLSYGSTLQFLNDCEYVTVMCYTDTKEKVWSRGLSPVENAKSKPKSVSICIKTSLNTYGDDGDVTTSLHLKGWTYLINSLNYFYTQGSSKPAFRGIDFFEYEGLEIMWRDHVQ
ncbi:MAG: hypothetical protein Q7J05_01485 [Paludibacter sp.]|nr:hypothetical protein [Paludibacter sp.]